MFWLHCFSEKLGQIGFFASTQVVGCGCRVCLRVRSKNHKKIAITIQSQIDESRFQIFVGNQISWKPLNILPLHKHQQRFSENFPVQQICTWSVFADRDDVDEVERIIRALELASQGQTPGVHLQML